MKRVSIVFLLLIVLWGQDAWADRLSVTASTANIRSGPGTQHDILWQVEKYHPLSVIKTTGSWYYFRDYEGDTGWIHKSLVGTTPTVITASARSNVRSGPGKTHKVLSSIESGVPFKILERKGRWVHVQHGDGDRGWIHESLLW